MAKYIGTILTKKGKDLLVRATLGEVMTFTKVEIGKGIIPEGANKEDLVSLIESFKTLSITSTTILEAGNYRVRVAFNNSGILEDTYLRETGVFARGEDGIEVLYSYCDTATPDLIPRESSGVLERVEDIITYISSAGTVNAVIDQSNVYVTIKDLNDGLALKEPKFNKNSGFNLGISHLVNSASEILVASAKAVKTAFDKGLEALGLANTNKNAIQNNTEQIENLSIPLRLSEASDGIFTTYSNGTKEWKGSVRNSGVQGGGVGLDISTLNLSEIYSVTCTPMQINSGSENSTSIMEAKVINSNEIRLKRLILTTGGVLSYPTNIVNISLTICGK